MINSVFIDRNIWIIFKHLQKSSSVQVAHSNLVDLLFVRYDSRMPPFVVGISHHYSNSWVLLATFYFLKAQRKPPKRHQNSSFRRKKGRLKQAAESGAVAWTHLTCAELRPRSCECSGVMMQEISPCCCFIKRPEQLQADSGTVTSLHFISTLTRPKTPTDLDSGLLVFLRVT